MRIIAVGTLRDFWTRPGRGDAEQALKTWIQVVKAAEWTKPSDVKRTFRSADILRNGRVVFDIGGNKYRLIAAIHYRGQRLYVRFIGSHSDYNKINVEIV